MVLGLLAVACGSGDDPDGVVDPPPSDEERLLGSWRTEGVDAVFGPVVAVMTLEADGSLRIALLLDGGAQRTYPGTWQLEGDQLVLRGPWFGETGERRVLWALRDDGMLELEEDGRKQEWRR